MLLAHSARLRRQALMQFVRTFSAWRLISVSGWRPVSRIRHWISQANRGSPRKDPSSRTPWPEAMRLPS
ncbi:hypothetical protein HNQ08_005275 [Deinococcus humi]|uniref:Uncharacterized protein n=1 Tax=Deinococcus humi TaxID=662880 RepID=A0A7W8K270_9DEIO|nr:hypothetical protein [Deinococcus humi]